MSTLLKPVDDSEVSFFRKQLSVARNEINNLRQQIRALGHSHQQEVDKIQKALDDYQQNVCTCSARLPPSDPNPGTRSDDGIYFQPIGVVNTWFPQKRGIPRQPATCSSSRGKLTLFNTVFTNPEHSLEGLEGFSHMWILFHFHKNDSTHVRAKVSPPRLNGTRTGVYGTRSPHRPCPIGLSLVAVDRIEGRCVHFSGVDMVDGTPVLDIKPYVPRYDDPGRHGSPGGDASPTRLTGVIGEREAPDGEEGTPLGAAAPAPAPSASVRVPSWIDRPPVSGLTVEFGDEAAARLEGEGDDVKAAVDSVLREDPRSVYLREKWGNQSYTFLIHNLHITCKFDDCAHKVTVYRVKSAGKTCQCGQPEWQCSLHGDQSE